MNFSTICLFCIEQEDEEANTGSHLKLIVDAFIQQLPNCVNRDLIDKVMTDKQESRSLALQKENDSSVQVLQICSHVTTALICITAQLWQLFS